MLYAYWRCSLVRTVHNDVRSNVVALSTAFKIWLSQFGAVLSGISVPLCWHEILSLLHIAFLSLLLNTYFAYWLSLSSHTPNRELHSFHSGVCISASIFSALYAPCPKSVRRRNTSAVLYQNVVIFELSERAHFFLSVCFQLRTPYVSKLCLA